MQFDFGENWASFSAYALKPENVRQAKLDFARLMQGIELSEKSFLDIGFGQGLSLLIAAAMGAKVVGCDINPACGEVLEENRRFFPALKEVHIPVIIGSFLDDAVLAALKEASPDKTGAYDVVHSWGVLHHTGEMTKAVTSAASLVKPDGYLVLAIYNRHWTSPIWRCIKLLYNKSPISLKKFMILLFYPIIYVTKFVLTWDNPKKQNRGMDFYYDVIDWVGGYPYEYATIDEIVSLVRQHGFDLRKGTKAAVPTGCNEFIFKKSGIATYAF